MMRGRQLFIASLALLCAGACAEVFVRPEMRQSDAGIVANPGFESGGWTYADHWRPLPGVFRMHRRSTEEGEHSLYLELWEAGDAGVIQRVDLPPRRRLSLRLLATCWADETCSVVATLIRESDRRVLCEVGVDGIERGMIGENFETGPGGPAELLLRLVGARGGRCLIDHVAIGPPLPEPALSVPDFSADDLRLTPGEGLRVEADFEPRLLPAAAEMVQEAIADLTGTPITKAGATLRISLQDPPATEWPDREAYQLRVDRDGAEIVARSEQGAFWGMMTLLDLLRPEPEGGARVVAVSVRDAPKLPLRIGSHEGLSDPVTAANAARVLARLKYNAAVIPRASDDDSDEVAIDAVRDLGIEPVILISGDAPDLNAAMQDAVERVGARFLCISPPVDDGAAPDEPLAWSSPPLSDVAAFAAEHQQAVTVMMPAAARTRAADGGQEFTGVPISLETWPAAVVACLYPSAAPDHALSAAREIDERGASSVFYHFEGRDGALRALQARAEGIRTVGVLATGDLAGAAELAWQGPPED